MAATLFHTDDLKDTTLQPPGEGDEGLPRCVSVCAGDVAALKAHRQPVLFTPKAWETFEAWETSNAYLFAKTVQMIRQAMNDPTDGPGKPERLRFEMSGFIGRRINQEHRLVYAIRDGLLVVAQMGRHYKSGKNDKEMRRSFRSGLSPSVRLWMDPQETESVVS